MALTLPAYDAAKLQVLLRSHGYDVAVSDAGAAPVACASPALIYAGCSPAGKGARAGRSRNRTFSPCWTRRSRTKTSRRSRLCRRRTCRAKQWEGGRQGARRGLKRRCTWAACAPEHARVDGRARARRPVQVQALAIHFGLRDQLFCARVWTMAVRAYGLPVGGACAARSAGGGGGGGGRRGRERRRDASGALTCGRPRQLGVGARQPDRWCCWCCCFNGSGGLVRARASATTAGERAQADDPGAAMRSSGRGGARQTKRGQCSRRARRRPRSSAC